MKYTVPKPIDLTPDETVLYLRIPKEPTDDGWPKVADAMEELIVSLLNRDAIPTVRLSLFSDPQFAETGNKSIEQRFESNGTAGKAIYRHPHFIPYLRYFIQGPELPKEITEGLCKLLNEDQGTSGMVLNQGRKYARQSIRDHGLNPSDAATEFFRLGVEIGMGISNSRSIRDAAKTTR